MKFIIYQVEEGGIGYKPAKVDLPIGARICLDRQKFKFAKVKKVVESTPKEMKFFWDSAKHRSRCFSPAYFDEDFLGMFE